MEKAGSGIRDEKDPDPGSEIEKSRSRIRDGKNPDLGSDTE